MKQKCKTKAVKKTRKKRQKKKRQGRLVLLTLLLSLSVLTWGVVTAYDNTRTLGFGDTSGMVNVFEASNGRRFVQIDQKQVDLDAMQANISAKCARFLEKLEQFIRELF